MAKVKIIIKGDAIAQWIRLLLPSCHPGFESQALVNVYLNCVMEMEKTKTNKKVAGNGPFLNEENQPKS